MADSKITALTSISTSTDPAVDPLVIVDVSDTSMAATGTTKKVTLNNLLSSSPTATGAFSVTGLVTAGSATITGDLTVRTTGLILNTSGLGVGITPTSFGAGYGTIQVSGATGAGIRMGSPTNPSFIYSDASFLNINTSTNIPHRFFVNNNLQFRIDDPGVFAWYDGAGGTRMTLNATGLGVGGSPATGLLTVGATTNVSATANALTILSQRANFSITANGATDAAGTTINYSWANGTQGPLIFRNAAIANVMTLDASGNLVIGNALASGVGATGGLVSVPNSGNSYHLIGHTTGTSSGANFTYYFYAGSVIGSITQNGTTGVLFNTTSDYRLKESVKPISGGLARVNALKPSVYNWKSDGSAGEGFLAHELAEVVPAAVTGEKDAVNADGTIKSQGIDMSRIVPILVAAIQELTARVQTLEAR